MERKIKRNMIRQRVGNRHVRDVWENYQRSKYGEAYEQVCRQRKRR